MYSSEALSTFKLLWNNHYHLSPDWYYLSSGLGIYCRCDYGVRAGVPNHWVVDRYSCQISGGIRLEIKCTINVMCFNHPETITSTPSPWENCLPRNQSLVPKRLGTSGLEGLNHMPVLKFNNSVVSSA